MHAREPVGKAARERAEAVRLHIAHRRIRHQLGVFRQGEHLREHAQDDRLRHRLLEQVLGARSQRLRGRAPARGSAVNSCAHRAAERIAAAVFGEKAPDVRRVAVARLARGVAQCRDPRPHGRRAQQRRERLRRRGHDAHAREEIARRRLGQTAHGQRLAARSPRWRPPSAARRASAGSRASSVLSDCCRRRRRSPSLQCSCSLPAFLSCPASRPRESPWRCRDRPRAAHSKTRSGRCAPRCRG